MHVVEGVTNVKGSQLFFSFTEGVIGKGIGVTGDESDRFTASTGALAVCADGRSSLTSSFWVPTLVLSVGMAVDLPADLEVSTHAQLSCVICERTQRARKYKRHAKVGL